MSALLALYHRLPTPARSLAATMRGWYLRWWRYGPARERLEEEALAREQWSAAQWQAWREERLAYVLHRAATRVPYYRDQWAARRRLGDRTSWELLEHWPILSKEHLRAQPRAFVADDRRVWRLYGEQSSGTTGTPVRVWKSRDAIARLYALSTTRARGWHGVSRNERWAMIGGQMVVPVDRRRPPFWVWNGALRQLYLSSYHLAPDLIPSYLDALRRYGVVYLMGYTSSLYALALEALRLGRRDLKVTVAITCAEPLVDYQRAAIAQAFQCPVRETYGMVEAVVAASECASGHLHLWPEVGVVEAMENDEPVAAGQFGDLVCTGLLNADMPLVRYAAGDRGALATQTRPCRCGRLLPELTAVAGRTDDVLYTLDGRRIGRLSPVVKGLAVREAQIVQEGLSRIRVRYVPAPEFTAQTERALVGRLRERMGTVDVILEPVERIPRTANGKFRAVVNALLPAERARILGAVRG